MEFASKWNLQGVHRVTDLEKNPVRISKDEADEQQVHNMIPKMRDTPIPWNKR